MEPYAGSWRVGGAEVIATLKGHDGPINNVKFNSGGDYCITCSQDKTLVLWNPHKALWIKQYKSGHNHGVSDVCIVTDNSKFVSVGGDFAALLWDVAEAKVIRKFIGHTGKLECCKLSPTGEVLCSGSYDKSVRLWDLRSSNRMPIQILSEASDSISSICVSDTEIISGSVDGCVRCYDIRMGKMSCDDFRFPVTSVSLSQDGTCILLSCLDQKIYLIEKLTGEIVSAYKGHTHTKYKINSTLTPFDECVVSGSEDHKIFMWDVLEGSDVHQKRSQNIFGRKNTNHTACLQGHGDAVVAVEFHPEQNIMLSASSDRTVKVWKNSRSSQ